MYGKLVVLFAFAVLAFAREYPAGLNPAICPDYPNCDPSVLARYTPEGMPIPEWELPAFGFYRTFVAPAPFPIVPVPEILRAAEPAEIAEAPKYPADFDSSKCPNYPLCTEVVEPFVPEALPVAEPAKIAEAPKYPADFDSAKCPNYPTCSEVVEPLVPEPLPLAKEADIIEAPKYPADFDSSKCPNYPYCS